MNRKTFIFTLIFCLAVTGISFAAGLKKTVAVFEFENDSGFTTWAKMGEDFSDQLTDSLMQSGGFIVLSRKDLDVVMAEQDLAASNRFAKAKAAQTGKIVPAQILVKGKITDFEENTSGSGQGLSIKGISIGTKSSAVSIGVIVQLIDSTTGEVLASKRIDGEAKSGGLSLGYSGAWDFGSSNFKKTPVGKAVQMAIDRAVAYIAKELSSVAWSAKVITVKDGTIFINAGSNAGVNSGDTFTLYSEGEALIDPDTGMNLGSDRKKLGMIVISSVQEKFSKATTSGFNIDQVSVGDVVLK
ncbi:MAG: hypothetical protein JXD21_07345 [Candidatus Omnitrophica bacterium]|nr:hypothetical protein [Candidatus Omnitrophota bacterium]